MLAKAKEKEGSDRVKWVYGDARHLPFKDASFDCTLMAFLLQHVEDKEQALREAGRVLKTGGRCLIVTTDPEQFKEDLLYRSFPKLLEIDLRRFPTIAWLKECLTLVGFREVFHRKVEGPSREILISEWLERVEKRYISTLTLLSEEEFAQGLKVFRERLKQEYGEKMRRSSKYTFIVGTLYRRTN
jgi:ubiquinone/menaquinone biosynthesis C-methylase UbiE